MLDLGRLRLLHELHARGTIAAVAEALQFTPSAVSQQLSVLEGEAGVALLEPAGRGVRLTDAALVLVGHADALLELAERAESELAAATGAIAGRGRIASFQSVAFHVGIPAMRALGEEAPDLRTELVEAEPEESLPALELGDYDLVLADEWQHQPRPRRPRLVREDLGRDEVRVVLPQGHRLAGRRRTVELAELAGEAWVTGHPGTGWDEVTERTCRDVGGFDPDIRHRSNDSVMCLRLVAAERAVCFLPDLVQPGEHPEVTVRSIAETSLHRTIFMATRATDAERPSVRALAAAVRSAATDYGLRA